MTTVASTNILIRLYKAGSLAIIVTHDNPITRNKGGYHIELSHQHSLARYLRS
jgi:hypothetical protein